MNDPMAEIRASFFVECEDLTEGLNDALIRLDGLVADGCSDAETINSMFRAVHSIKGGAAAFSLDALVGYAHRLESVFEVLRSGQLTPTAGIVQWLQQAADGLSDHLRAAASDTDAPTDDAALVNLEAALPAPAGAPAAAAFAAFAPIPLDFGFDPVPAPLICRWRITLTPQAGLYQSGNEVAHLLRALTALGMARTQCVIPDDLTLDGDCAETPRLAWVVSVEGEIARSEIEEIFDFVGDVCAVSIVDETSLPDAPEGADSDPIPPATATGPSPAGSSPAGSSLAGSSPSVSSPAGRPPTSPSPVGPPPAWMGGPTHPAPPHGPTRTAPSAADKDMAPAAGIEDRPQADAQPSAIVPPAIVSPAILPAAILTGASQHEVVPQTGSRPGTAPPAEAAPVSIRVDLDKIDRLLNLVSELVINQAMLAESIGAAGVAHPDVITGLDGFLSLTREIQDGVMSVRAQPVKPLFQRMGRIVREAAAATSKSVRLQTIGEATEVDKTLIERLADPLTHIIRNAVDHGIEPPTRRADAGKPGEGLITLSAHHSAGRIVIEVSDDGGGINRDRVRATAITRGLIAPDAALTEAEVDNLLFLPGFSTAEKVSSLSGRGVGMDVVKSAIAALGGRIALSSEIGRGTTMSISLPLTLAVLDGMVVSAGGQTFVVPLAAIIETARLEPASIKRVGMQTELLNMRGELIPLIDLAGSLGFRAAAGSGLPCPAGPGGVQGPHIATLGPAGTSHRHHDDRVIVDHEPMPMAGPGGAQDRGAILANTASAPDLIDDQTAGSTAAATQNGVSPPDATGRRDRQGDPRGGIVLLVNQDHGNRAALIVDAIMEPRQVVIKGLGQLIGPIPGVVAATILGGGQVALILDPANLPRSPRSGPVPAIRSGAGPDRDLRGAPAPQAGPTTGPTRYGTVDGITAADRPFIAPASAGSASAGSASAGSATSGSTDIGSRNTGSTAGRPTATGAAATGSAPTGSAADQSASDGSTATGSASSGLTPMPRQTPPPTPAFPLAG